MDIDLATLPDDVETLQRMVRTLATERASLTEAQAEIEAFGSSFRSCSAANLVGAPNGSMTTSCSSVLKTSTPISRGSKPRCHQRQSRRRDRGPIDQACRRICPARTCGSISSIKRAPAAAANCM
jgi:hypothetical protein